MKNIKTWKKFNEIFGLNSSEYYNDDMKKKLKLILLSNKNSVDSVVIEIIKLIDKEYGKKPYKHNFELGAP